MEKLDLNIYKNGKNVIQHEGIISSVSNKKVTVLIKGNVNCEACNAKSACGVSDSNTKEVEVFNPSENYKVNQNVQVTLQKELGFKAVFWAYVFPFMLMLLTLVVASNFMEEWQAGLLSLVVLIPYYLIVYMLNDFFRKAFKISIEKINE